MPRSHRIPSPLKRGVSAEGDVAPQALEMLPRRGPGSVHLSVLSLRLSHSALQHLGIPETWGFIILEFPPPAKFLRASQRSHSKRQNKAAAWGFLEGWEAGEGPGGPIHNPSPSPGEPMPPSARSGHGWTGQAQAPAARLPQTPASAGAGFLLGEDEKSWSRLRRWLGAD